MKISIYIYFTAHTHKHFSISGCGIRTLIDYYLFLKNNHLDFDYINKELSRLDLLGFSNTISSLSKKIFENQNLNEEKETLLFIASSGTYGILEHSVSKGVKEKGRFRYFMSRIFPPMEYYKRHILGLINVEYLFLLRGLLDYLELYLLNLRKQLKN